MPLPLSCPGNSDTKVFATVSAWMAAPGTDSSPRKSQEEMHRSSLLLVTDTRRDSCAIGFL